MLCPYCGGLESSVTDKRNTRGNKEIRRRRECKSCGKRFTTYEKIGFVEIFVKKKDGRIEKFDANKLRTSIIKACEKRPIELKEIDKVVVDIKSKLLKRKAKEVKSSVIGDIVMKHLKKIDNVAYIRFASVYKDFHDIETFEKELKKIRSR